jgi:hypothetical protein
MWNNAQSVNAVHSAGNTTTESRRKGIHSYHEDGANKDKPKNRTANEAKTKKGLFITTPLSSFPRFINHRHLSPTILR